MSLAILTREIVDHVERARHLHKRVVGGHALKFAWIGREIDGAQQAHLLAEGYVEARRSVEPGADRRSTRGSRRRRGSVSSIRAIPFATCLANASASAHRHGNRVHQMGSANLDNVFELGRLCRERSVQFGQRRNQPIPQFECTREMHHRRKAVIRRLRAVDVIVRMHRRFRSEGLPRRSLARFAITSLAFIFVCVPDPVCQIVSGKSASNLPSRYLLGRSFDRRGEFDLEDTQTTVRTGRCELLQSEGADQSDRKSLLSDREQFQGALRLRTPISIGRDLYLAEYIALDANRAFQCRHCPPVTPAALMIGAHLSISERR